MSDVVLYTKSTCPYCRAAKALLRRKQVDFREYEISTSPALREEMIAKSGRRTVPQIFIDGRAIGGYDDLAALQAAGKLDDLLSGKSVEKLAA
ncbi:MAG: glutaredoxin 3 [Filomicrobium sp.]